MLQSKKEKNILWFKDISIKDIAFVGGKNASLGEMYNHLKPKGVEVPNGFAVTAFAYQNFLEKNDLNKKIKDEIKKLDIADVRLLREIGSNIRSWILAAHFPKELEKEIISAYAELSKQNNLAKIAVAVRSSATAEDLPDASFAGQQETYLNVVGKKELLLAVKKCVASLFTDRAISYRETKGFDHLTVALSVTVQIMVESDKASSGVMFTLDTESGFDGVVLINASYGLGEYVVKGRVTPDQFYVFKKGLEKQVKNPVISHILGSKEVKLVYHPKGGTRQMKVKLHDRNKLAISDAEAAQLARWGVEIEKYYQRPQDIEWAKDGRTGKLYIVQARPETVKSHSDHSVIETYILMKKGKLIVRGSAVGQKIGAGRARVINNPAEMKQFKKGEILITRITDPDWEPIMRIASAIVTEQGGKTSHAAIVSRELGVPCVVGAKDVRKLVKTGESVTVCCAEGEEGNIYKGLLPFEVKKTEIKQIKKTSTKIMMNVGDPDNAFPLSFLPNDGVGLARLEFIFTNFIRIHPLALLNYNSLQDKKAKKQIADLTKGYKKKADYCIDKLAEGIARIASAFYPHEVIVRLSDFKTNEYATLIGGKEFEPKEENPMLGWRGASRYYSESYKPGFALECAAIKKAREDMGLDNIIVMVPFCRTPEEGEMVIKTMEEFGLKRGENGLQVYVMCEIPSNVILAEEFAKIFDGFSIGSNDLTQLTLGVDRDSALVSHVYNERNKAVLELIRNVIKIAHKNKRKVGICGQAPSDYPEFAEFLVKQGIDSISLNPDTVISTRERIAMVEKTLGRTGKKTNFKFLSFVAIIATVGATVITLGAGCGRLSTNQNQNQNQDQDILAPAMIRERIMEKTEQTVRENNAELANSLVTLKERGFADFDIQYPTAWQVEHGKNFVTLKNNDNEYLKIFVQLEKHNVADSERQKLNLNGFEVEKYLIDSQVASSTAIQVVEIKYDEKVLEINGVSPRFDELVSTFKKAEN